MIQTLVQLMRTMEEMPEEHWMLMKLGYYDDVATPDYEPPFFRGSTKEEAYHQYIWLHDKHFEEIAKGVQHLKHLISTLEVF
ncbi:HORMA domain [Orobanche gracilis]